MCCRPPDVVSSVASDKRFGLTHCSLASEVGVGARPRLELPMEGEWSDREPRKDDLALTLAGEVNDIQTYVKLFMEQGTRMAMLNQIINQKLW